MTKQILNEHTSLSDLLFKCIYELYNLKKIVNSIIASSNAQKKLNKIIKIYPNLKKPVEELQLRLENNKFSKSQIYENVLEITGSINKGKFDKDEI